MFKNPVVRIAFSALVAMAFFALVLGLLFPGGKKTIEGFTYEDFKAQVEAGNIVSSVTTTVGKNGRTISGELASGEKFVLFTDRDKDKIYEMLDSYDLKSVEKAPSSSNWGLLISILLPIILFGILLFLFTRSPSQGTSVVNNFSRVKGVRKEVPTVTFADVAGQEEAVEETKEIVDFLRDRDQFLAMGARLPKGALLTGPPGTGKTLLARAVAGEANAPFFAVSGSQFVELYVGVGAARVRDLFNQAKANQPSVVFIDELDAVGRHRGAGVGGGHDEREQTLNQILVEMDGFDINAGIIVIAATNRPDILDPALLRPGRFDRKIVLALPDLKGRQAILNLHAKGKPIQEDVSLRKIAQETPGFSGADLANIVNEAAILAVRRKKSLIGSEEFGEAIDRVIAGPQRKSAVFSQKEKEMIAFHEAGHALTGWVLPNADRLHKVSIMARANFGGYTKFLPDEDRHLLTQSQLQDQLVMTLGGRVAEELQFGEPSTGAENDLDHVREIAWQMVTRFAMAQELPPQAFGKTSEMVFLGREISTQRDYGDEVAKKIDQAMARIIQGAYEKARTILIQRKDKLTEVAQELVKRETLAGEELEKLLADLPKISR